MLRLAASLLLGLGLVSATEDVSERALLLTQKSVGSDFAQVDVANLLVEDRNFTVTVSLHNVGGQEAYDIEVEDEWEEDKFTVVDGSMRATFAKLSPGESEEFSFTLVPNFNTFPNLYEYKPAMVTYMYGDEDDQMETIATSSRPHTRVPNQDRILDGKTYILSEKDYLAQTAMYFREWTTFALLAAGPVLAPALILSFLQSSTESILKAKAQ
jgi:hypothetical protein